MRWRVMWVEAEGFMPFDRMRLEFDKLPSLVMLAGDRGPGRSNGSGKSAVLEAITYALFGRTVRKLAAGREIKRGHKSCVVRACVELGDGRQVVVERGRGPSGPTCRVTGLDPRALAAGAQQALDGMLGGYDLFTTTAMFTGDAASFCRKSDAARKELLEHMLGIRGYDAAAEKAKAELDEVSVQRAKVSADVEYHARSLADLVERRANLSLEAMLAHSEKVRAYKEAVARAVELSDLAQVAAQAVAEWMREASAQQGEADAQREAAEGRAQAAQDLIDSLLKEQSDLRAQSGVLGARVSDLLRQVSEVRSGTHADVCPTCGQRWPQDEDPDDVAKVVARHEAELAKVRKQLAPLTARLADLSAEVHEATSARGIATAAARAAVAKFDQGRLRTLLAEVAEAEADLAQAHEAVARAAAVVSDEPEADPRLESLSREVEAARAGSEAARERLAELDKRAELLAFWRKGFGRTGLPSFLVDSSIPGMNEEVAAVAAALTDGELRIRFDAAATKGGQNVLGVEVDYAEGGEGFDSASKGEKARVDVAVLFALRDVAAKASSAECGQLFLDEVMDGADQHFSQAFVRMLRQRYKGRQVLLVTHDPTVMSLVDRVLWVRKRGRAAVLS